MARRISSVAVLGGGTMGTGIAGACAEAGHRVLLLDVSAEAAEKAMARITDGRPPAIDDPAAAANISLGTLDDDLGRIADYDWICEAVVEDVAVKRALMARLEPLRRDGSVVSTNTSGIPLHAITEGLPPRLRQDIAVTHFFNPVKVMKLMELVPGADTSADTIACLAEFCAGTLGKGVVHAKDTVNFIGNRIGCFWMLSGLHKATAARNPRAEGGPGGNAAGGPGGDAEGGPGGNAAGGPGGKPGDGRALDMETIDALMSAPVGLPSTGLYGLIDLIGLDVMDLVGTNLAANLPEADIGRAYTRFPTAERAMLARGQLGRKTGAGFYKLTKLEDGSRHKEVFDLDDGAWRDARTVTLDAPHTEAADLFFADDAEGGFAWALMGGALLYAADLVPEIADDVVNIDRAMRWGFAWKQGPFELLDTLSPARVIARLRAEDKPLPRMLDVLDAAGVESFYRADGREFLGLDGAYHPVPPA